MLLSILISLLSPAVLSGITSVFVRSFETETFCVHHANVAAVQAKRRKTGPVPQAVPPPLPAPLSNCSSNEESEGGIHFPEAFDEDSPAQDNRASDSGSPIDDEEGGEGITAFAMMIH